MATLTINLTDPESVSTAIRALTALRPGCDALQTDDTFPSEFAREQGRAVQDAPTTPALTHTPADTTEPNPNKLDVNGLSWNEEIHSFPPRHNADGSWRVRKGRKAEYDAAVEAVRAALVPEQADRPAASSDRMEGPSMGVEHGPQPDTTEPKPPAPAMPAAPVPTMPEPPVDYETMGRRFVAMMTSGKIRNFKEVYQALEIDYEQLETNQTMIVRLMAYMDALDNGEAHEGAVRHARGLA